MKMWIGSIRPVANARRWTSDAVFAFASLSTLKAEIAAFIDAGLPHYPERGRDDTLVFRTHGGGRNVVTKLDVLLVTSSGVHNEIGQIWRAGA